MNMTNMKKTMVSITAALAAIVASAGDSAPILLDLVEGTRIAREVETITYSTAWEGGERVCVAVDGVTLKEAVAPASGEVDWNAANASPGIHTLTHTTYKGGVAGKVETVTFQVGTVYTVTFDANGGSLGTGTANPRPVADGAAVGALPTPALDGYSFAGWWTDASGGTQITGQTAVTGDVTFYAHWTKTPSGDGGDIGGSGGGGGNGGGSIGGVDTGGGVSQPWTAQKAVTLDGAVYDAEGNVAGVVQLKVAKPNAKKHNAKVSGAVTLLDGKKRTLKAAAFTVPSDKPISANVSVKGLGTLLLVIGGDGFEGSVGGYSIAAAKVGGKWTRTDARVYADATSALPPGTVEELLPDGEPVRAKSGKWAFDKAASIKYAKGVLSGHNDPKKPNLSAMKLTYTPKTGLFKGSFKLYAIQGGKLKKFTVKVTGVVVDGEGTGVGKLAKPATTWSVRVE